MQPNRNISAFIQNLNIFVLLLILVLSIIITGCHSTKKSTSTFQPVSNSVFPVSFHEVKIPVDIKLKVKNSRLTTFVFLSAVCPICSKCAEELEEAFESVHGENVAFYAIFPNKEKQSQIRKFKKYYNLQFPVYADKDKNLAKFFNASVTPMAVVVDSLSNIVYHGALDNRNYIASKNSGVEIYFLNAIKERLNGSAIQVGQVQPMGCHIH